MLDTNVFPWIEAMRLFQDRHDAGRQLAQHLFQYADENPLVLALPRGGVPIGFEVANLLNASLDVLVARKIGLPKRPEFGIGAIAEGNIQLLDIETLAVLGLSPKDLQKTIEEETAELKRRVSHYRGTTKPLQVKNRSVILVDDGLATGVTARAAIEGIKKLKPKKVIFASPVCAYDSAKQLADMVDGVVCLATPLEFMAVGMWYHYFDQATDKEVLDLLKKSKHLEKKGKSRAGKMLSRRPVKGKHHAEPEAYMH